MRWSSLRWQITGSMAARRLNWRLNWRLICSVTRRFGRRVDAELVIGQGIVAAIAGIGDDALEHVTDQRS